MSRKGRILKLTPELTTAFADAVGGGMSRAKAAAVIGVTPKTVCVWMKLGREQRTGPYVNFVHAVRTAEARFIATNLAAVRRAATPSRRRVTRTTTRADGSVETVVTEQVDHDWQAARWLLECKDPETFGPYRKELREVQKKQAELRRLLEGKKDAALSALIPELVTNEQFNIAPGSAPEVGDQDSDTRSETDRSPDIAGGE